MDDENLVLQQVVGINPSLSVLKTADLVNADGSDDTDDVIDSAGDTILYTISVTNTGDTTLSGVVLIDPFIQASLDKNGDGVIDLQDIVSGDENNNGLLDLGETWVWTGSYQVTQEDIDNRGTYDSPIDSDTINDNLIRNVVFVSTDQGATEDAQVDTTLDYDPQVRVIKTANVLNADGSDDTDNIVDTAGDVIAYTVRVINIGNVSLHNFQLTDDLGISIFDRNGDGVTDVLDVVSGDNGNGVLDVGEEWVLSGLYEVTQSVIDSRGTYDGPDSDTLNDNIIRNTVQVTTQTFDQNVSGVGDSNTEVDYRPVILIHKEAMLYNPDGTVDEDGAIDQAGDLIHYTLRVSNTGNVTLSNVVVVDPMIAATMDKNADGIIDVNDSDGGDDNANGLLDVGEVWLFSGSYEVTQAVIDARGTYDGPDPDTLNDNIVRNFAGVTSLSTDAQQVTRDTFVDTRVVLAPGLSIQKTADVNEVDEIGDVIEYTIAVSNTGNITLSGITVTDPLIQSTLAPRDLDMDGVIDGDLDADGLLDVGETWYWIGQYQVSSDDYAAAMASLDPYFILNTATADSNETDPTTDTEEVLVKVQQPFEGLSPGYWKNHPEDWDGAATAMSFEEFFFGSQQPGLNWKVMSMNGGGRDRFATEADITLMQALELTGGDAAALARSAVAAVLNARDEDVTYQFSESQIKTWVTDALSGQPVDLDDDGTPEFAAGKMAIEGVKNLLDFNNNLGLV
jgi:uncharacterized repeat protein (TIGR01451 family)